MIVVHRNGTADGRQCRRVAESSPGIRRGTGGTRIDICIVGIRDAPNLRPQHVQVRADLADADVAQRLEPVGDGQVQTKHAVDVHVIATGGGTDAEREMRHMTRRGKFQSGLRPIGFCIFFWQTR